MDDDLNTADAVSVIFELVRAINIAVEKTPTKALAQACLEMLHEFTQVLGLLYQKKGEENLDAKVEAMIQARQAARKEKNFAEADRIRDELKAMGITLMDTPGGEMVQGMNFARIEKAHREPGGQPGSRLLCRETHFEETGKGEEKTMRVKGTWLALCWSYGACCWQAVPGDTACGGLGAGGDWTVPDGAALGGAQRQPAGLCPGGIYHRGL